MVITKNNSVPQYLVNVKLVATHSFGVMFDFLSWESKNTAIAQFLVNLLKIYCSFSEFYISNTGYVESRPKRP